MLTKSPSPLLGYNNNVRHKGKVFHIQTEDSGVKYGHIITHLFMDGGRILKSVKTSYSEYIQNERMGEIVREMMKQQHKAMFIALRDGKFDALMGSEASAPATGAVERAAAPSPAPAAVRDGAAPEAPLGSPPAVPAAKGSGEVLPPTLRQSLEEMMLDADAVERAGATPQVGSPVLRSNADLPPPPANLFREKGVTGKYRSTAPAAPPPPEGTSPVPAPSTPAAPAPARPIARAPAAPAVERRYAPTRPAAIFGQARPQQGKSIFGEDVLSDKSLDEVILNYLAEDLDADAKNRSRPRKRRPFSPNSTKDKKNASERLSSPGAAGSRGGVGGGGSREPSSLVAWAGSCGAAL